METTAPNPLLEDVKKWGDWVLAEAKKELECFYPARERTVQSRSAIFGRGRYRVKILPVGAEIPLMPSILAMQTSQKRRLPFILFAENGAGEF